MVADGSGVLAGGFVAGVPGVVVSSIWQRLVVRIVVNHVLGIRSALGRTNRKWLSRKAEGTGLEPVSAFLRGGFQDRCLTN